MTEFSPTDVPSFQQFIVDENARALQKPVQLSGARPLVVDFSEREMLNALNFMKDCEITHALWVDECIENPEECVDFPEDVERLDGDNVACANAINYATSQIRLGNAAIIAGLNRLEEEHFENFGTQPYTEARDWDGDLKWGAFLEFMMPTVPDAPPPNLAGEQ